MEKKMTRKMQTEPKKNEKHDKNKNRMKTETKPNWITKRENDKETKTRSSKCRQKGPNLK
jgi:hypothetical protein